MTLTETSSSLLASGTFVDSDNGKVRHFARDAIGQASEPVEQIKRIYYRVRDDFRYDPYIDYADPKSYRASTCIDEGRGFCIPKAALMAASARTLGIPARVGYADVRNHLTTERLLQHLGSNVFIFHGYAELWVEGRWVKATPCFNLSLCERFGVAPLDFDGRNDAMLHPYDTRRRMHMEYLRQRGVYDDVPFDEIVAEMRATYPVIFKGERARLDGDFAAEAAAGSA
ncbi:MAG: transglutaminase-like domain-containing protein [Burkholderiales bacterium]